MITVSVITLADDLQRLVDEINRSAWDDANDIAEHGRTLLGIASGRFELATEANCEVVWLGTEIDNHAANALYRSLEPDEVMQFVGYTYELED